MPHIDNATLIRQNTEHWALASYHPDALAKAKPVAARLCASRAKMIYQQIEQDTGVPWFIVAVIHEREASQRWDRQLGQGDPLDQVSRHVPKGRGPFATFIDGAVDALKNCAPYLARWHNWTAGGSLTGLELYNGTGYESFHHMASPYVWGGSDIYHVGKYVADGKFDATVEDHQLGCAVLLKCMMEIDSSISFTQTATPIPLPPERPARADEEDEGGAVVPPATSPAPPPPAMPQTEEAPPSNPNEGKPAHKSKITWLSWIMSFLGLGGVTTNLQDATLDSVQQAVQTIHDKGQQVKDIEQHIGLGTILAHAAARPNFLLFVGIMIAGAAIAIFWYRDHGPGSLKK